MHDTSIMRNNIYRRCLVSKSRTNESSKSIERFTKKTRLINSQVGRDTNNQHKTYILCITNLISKLMKLKIAPLRLLTIRIDAKLDACEAVRFV